MALRKKVSSEVFFKLSNTFWLLVHSICLRVRHRKYIKKIIKKDIIPRITGSAIFAIVYTKKFTTLKRVKEKYLQTTDRDPTTCMVLFLFLYFSFSCLRMSERIFLLKSAKKRRGEKQLTSQEAIKFSQNSLQSQKLAVIRCNFLHPIWR